MENYIKRRYFATQKPGAYSGLSGFTKNSNYKKKDHVQKTLKELKTYNLHSPGRVRFPRNPVICPYRDWMWTSDIIIYDKYSHQNKGYKYIIIFVDCLSRMLYTAPLKNKDAKCARDAFQEIIKKSKRKPTLLWTDEDRCYKSKIFTDFLDKHKIKLYHVTTPLKASLSERYVRRVKTILARIFTKNNNHKWIDFLEPVTKNINDSYNRSIGMAPSQVNKKNESLVWYNLYDRYVGVRKDAKLHVGDYVKISKNKINTAFRKGYEIGWSDETFIVASVNQLNPVPFYSLKDQHGTAIQGTFYEQDLLKVSKLENSDD